ncbi:hypothetical protein ACN38_g12587 [Penicillium nordicum]|uniref:Secreted protein n=1 Tax=Penicillium nordicum TaxID=229535 RepID=A0A0M8NYA1_9EURO|nr:hypothetical protein ACN38_g12587 [Penicillium nordicum]
MTLPIQSSLILLALTTLKNEAFQYLYVLWRFASIKNVAFHQHTNRDILTFLDSLQVSKMIFFFSNKFRYLYVF